MKECNIFVASGVWDKQQKSILHHKKNLHSFVVMEQEDALNIPNDNLCYDLVLSGITCPSVSDTYDINLLNKISPPYELFAWPLAQIHTVKKQIDDRLDDIESINSVKETFDNKLYLNQTARPHKHRLQLLNYLHEKKMLHLGINTFRCIGQSHVPYMNLPWYSGIVNYDWYSGGSWISQEYLGGEWALELITETTTDYIRLTEKTFKPLFTKRPFLILGGKNIHEYLYNLGFKLFEEIFDYSFDSEDDTEKRIKGIVNNIRKLKKIKPYKIKKLLSHKIKENFEKAMEYIQNDTTVSPSFMEKILKFEKINLFNDNGILQTHSGQNILYDIIKKHNVDIEITEKELKI